MTATRSMRALCRRFVQRGRHNSVAKSIRLLLLPARADRCEHATLRDSRHVVIRSAGRRDHAAIRDLHLHCSDETLYSRYLGAVSQPLSDNLLRPLLDPARGATLVAADHSGSAVGMATLATVGGTEQAEIAILIEDDWQNSGLGRLLLSRACRLADRLGHRTVVAAAEPGNARMCHVLRSAGFETAERPADDLLMMRLQLTQRRLDTGPLLSEHELSYA